MIALSEPHFRLAKDGTVDELRLDTVSRCNEDNAINTDKLFPPTRSHRGINKGLVFEPIFSTLRA